jgi:hypothetical protein
MPNTNTVAVTGDPTEDWNSGDIAQNEQIAAPDGPMSREELEDAYTEGVFVTDYPL